MRQTYPCKNLGVEERGGCLYLKGGLLAGDYSNVKLFDKVTELHMKSVISSRGIHSSYHSPFPNIPSHNVPLPPSAWSPTAKYHHSSRNTSANLTYHCNPTFTSPSHNIPSLATPPDRGKQDKIFVRELFRVHEMRR